MSNQEMTMEPSLESQILNGAAEMMNEQEICSDENGTFDDLPKNGLNDRIFRKFILLHHYDIGDQSVHFSIDSLSIQEVRDLAVYLQIKAEKLMEFSVILSNLSIAQYLEVHGAKIIEKTDDFNPVGMFLIDIYSERESRICGSNWCAEDYKSIDIKFGESASIFLKNSIEYENWNKTQI